MTDKHELDRLLQSEWRESVIPNMGFKSNDPWPIVFQDRHLSPDQKVHTVVNSCLVPNKYVEQLVLKPEWDFLSSHLVPGFTGSYGARGDEPTYHRFGSNKYAIEPLVILRSFSGLKSDSLEILEEFRLYHNLYDDRQSCNLVKFSDGGNEAVIVKYSNDLVKVQIKEIRQFLAARDMSLVVCFARRYYSDLNIDDMDQKHIRSFGFCNMIYRLTFGSRFRTGKAYSRLLGKKLIPGLPREKCGIWPYATEEQERMNQLEEYCIGVDENGDDILASSAPYGRYAATMKLDIPLDTVIYDFCTPVFFKRTVLGKYYSEPSKYRVKDSYLECGRLWGIPFDSDQPDFVAVLLGDLGEALPATEHAHWNAHNVPPDGNLSAPYIRMSFPSTVEEALNPGTDNSAFRFKHTLSSLSSAWSNVFGWVLFKPLRNADAHHLHRIRRPLTNEPTEFHEIVLSLSILLQDRINKKELGKLIPDFEPKNKENEPKKNIPVLGEYLDSEGFVDAADYVEYLRMLQMLRSNSGTVHPRNEKEYQKAVRFFSLDTKSTIQVADDIFTTLTEFLDSLREHFCPNESD